MATIKSWLLGGLGLATVSAAFLWGVAGCSAQPAVFDVGLARRKGDLASMEVPGSVRLESGVPLREVRYNSTVWESGKPQTIRIQAFVAVPPGRYPLRSKPAVIFAHGLGGQADPRTAAELCRNLDVVALSLSGPGLGQSEGRPVTPQDPQPLFAGEDDIRKNWLYGYVFAILRSISFLETMTEVDPRAIAVTGFSLGGLATFIANGVDGRIRGALPMAASGSLAEAAAQDTWLRRLAQSAGKEGEKAIGAQTFFRMLDPLAYARRQRGVVYMLVGAQDEYFPLAQVATTYRALPGSDKRLAVVADYDHGWYFGGGCPARCMPPGPRAADCPAEPICPSACSPGNSPPYCGPEASYNRQEDFSSRWALLLRSLVANHVASKRRPYRQPPPAPRVERRDDEVLVAVTGPAKAVRLSVSSDCGYTYGQTELSNPTNGVYHYRRPVGTDYILIAEVESEDGAVSTNVPNVPTTCIPRLRPFGPRPQSAPGLGQQ